MALLRSLVLIGALGAAVAGAQEADLVNLAGDNLGRTEADDAAPEDESADAALGIGAQRLTVDMARSGIASVGLYTPAGRLLRILAQAIPLPAGPHAFRWDGLDLFGHPVPPGTALVLKTIVNDPLRAFYEFSVAAPKVAPWGGDFESGGQPRAGGWLGDHSAPAAVVAVGEQILLGCKLAEHGDNLIAVTQTGEKLWGAKLAGWPGPARLVADATTVYAHEAKENRLYKVQPTPQADPRGRLRVPIAALASVGPDPLRAMAVRDGKLYLLLANQARQASPFTPAIGNRDIDYERSRPQILDNAAPTEFMVGPQTAFGNTFTTPGNPQNGADMVLRRGAGYVLVVFKQPRTLGTVLLGPIAGAARTDIYVLKAGQAYRDEDSPVEASEPEAGLGAGLDFGDFSDTWLPFAHTERQAPLMLLAATGGAVRTQALYIKATPANPRDRDWRPRLGMARLLSVPVVPTPAPTTIAVTGEVARVEQTPDAGRGAWRLRAVTAIGELFPLRIVLGFDQPQDMDGILLLNCVNPDVQIETLLSGYAGDPLHAEDAHWRVGGRYRGDFDKRLRHLSASRKHNEAFVAFEERVTTRALRLTIRSGYRGGKWGEGDDFTLAENAGLWPVRLTGARPIAPRAKLRIVDAVGGKSLHEWIGNEHDLPVLAAAPAGGFFTVHNARLCRATLDEETGHWNTIALTEPLLHRAISIAVSASRVAIGEDADGEKAARVTVFDHAGRQQHAIGGHRGRQVGAWDPCALERPQGLAFAADGCLWIAEERFDPKRVARFGADGRFIEEFVGPPMYGGGGHLDPNLNAFYDRGVEYRLDWTAGVGRVAAINDRAYDPATPVQNANTFGYPGLGRPFLFNGRRYLARPGCMVREEAGRWLPAVVMGMADGNSFLLRKEVWNRHWARQTLAGRAFIWCDANEDGAYQIEEVEVFEPPFKDLWRGMALGPAFQLWGEHARLAPQRITAGGVPLYRSVDIQAFDYNSLAPHYPRNYTLAGPRSAKPAYSGFKYITQDGALIQEGQPYIVQADGTLLGGSPPMVPSDYIPPIPGVVLNTPWGFAGGAQTRSEIGEIAVVNSMRGYWFVWAARYGMVVGTFFDGTAGGWGNGLPVRREMDVTGRKQDWEGWHGDFVKAQDGRYFAQAGKGFYGISRIEGLDDFRLSETAVTVSADAATSTPRLRTWLRDRQAASAVARAAQSAKVLSLNRLTSRAPRFALDGETDEWGSRQNLHQIGPASDGAVFDVAIDEKGIYLALQGRGPLDNSATQPDALLGSGFAVELGFRKDARNRSSLPGAGDCRLVVARLKGKWSIYRQRFGADAAGAPRSSTYTDFVFPRYERLDAPAAAVAVHDAILDFDLKTGDSFETLSDEPTMLMDAPAATVGKPASKQKTDGQALWMMELFITWSSLERDGPQGGLFDIGLWREGLKPGQVTRAYWSNQHKDLIGDAGLDVLPNPAAWGALNPAP